MAQAPVKVFVGPLLPRAVGIAEVDLHTQIRLKPLIKREFFALVHTHGLAHFWGENDEGFGDTRNDQVTVFGGIFYQKSHARFAF